MENKNENPQKKQQKKEKIAKINHKYPRSTLEKKKIPHHLKNTPKKSHNSPTRDFNTNFS